MYKKLYIYFFLLMLGLAAGCSDDDDEAPTLSFRRPYYVLPSNQALNVELHLSVPAEKDLTIPFEVLGTAEENSDYSLSAHEFTLAAGQDSAVVTITPLNNMYSNREIKFQLVPTAGYGYGYYPTTIIPVETRKPFTTRFFRTEYNVYEKSQVAMDLYVGSSLFRSPSYEIKIPFEIDPSSTAVLGTHFAIEGGEQNFVYRQGDNKGRVYIKCLKKEAGKDKIVLRMVDNDMFMTGMMDYLATVYLNGNVNTDDLLGRWRFSKFSSKACVEEAAQMMQRHDDLKNLPVHTSEDILAFEKVNGNTVVRTSGLKGDLKNYFIDGASFSKMKIQPEQIFYEQEQEESKLLREVLLTECSQVNLSFSATDVNLSKAEVDFRILGNGDLLEVRVVQLVPTDFLQETYADYSVNDPGFEHYDKNLPLKGKYTLSFLFTKVK